jgi:tetratricopeptide (TPR) repeat protein
MAVRMLLGVAVVAALFSAPAQTQIESAWTACENAQAAPDERIKACTLITESKQESARNRAIAYNNSGNAKRRNKDAQGAIADYVEAIALDPTYVNAYINRGISYEDLRDLNRALADYEAAIERDPKGGYAYSKRADIAFRRGQFDQAIADYDRAIALNTTVPVAAYRGRAAAWREQGDVDRAIADYTAAIAIAPNSNNDVRERGFLYFSAGNFAAAAADFQRAIALKDDLYPALFRYLALSRGGQSASAALEADVSRLKSKDWPYAVAELYLGRSTPEALHAAASNADEKCEAEFYVGQWHLVRGEREQARPLLQGVVDRCSKELIEHAAAAAELRRWDK